MCSLNHGISLESLGRENSVFSFGRGIGGFSCQGMQLARLAWAKTAGEPCRGLYGLGEICRLEDSPADDRNVSFGEIQLAVRPITSVMDHRDFSRVCG